MVLYSGVLSDQALITHFSDYLKGNFGFIMGKASRIMGAILISFSIFGGLLMLPQGNRGFMFAIFQFTLFVSTAILISMSLIVMEVG